MLLPPPNHQAVAKLRRSWIINEHRGKHGQRVKCEAAELIHENQWKCSVEFVLGISEDIGGQKIELKNTSPPTQTVAEFNTSTMQSTNPVQLLVETKKEQTTCKNCGNEINWLDLERRKTLHHNEQYCSPACKTKFYRKHKKNNNL